MNKLNKMNYFILLMDLAYEVEISRGDCVSNVYALSILGKRFSYILFLDKCKIIWVNVLFADENCQKNVNATKCGEKFQMRPFM